MVIVVAIVALLIGGVIGWAVKPAECAVSQGRGSQMQASSSISQERVDFSKAMRKLWDEHVSYTRLYIVEAVAGLPGSNETAARLLKNQEDMGNAIKPYYGEEAGNKLTALLKEHINGAVAVLTAAKAGDNAKLETAKKDWYTNANEITDFLATANPNWSKDELRSEMKMHLDLTLNEAVAQLQGNYAESVNVYDEVHKHILGFADILTDGIVKQFPDKFK